MLIQTSSLKPGVIMANGEKVINAFRSQTDNKVMFVVLQNSKGKERATTWRYHGSVFVKSVPE